MLGNLSNTLIGSIAIVGFVLVVIPFIVASFLRNVAFMVPAGLGVQDLSYLTFLRALDVNDALELTAAFLLLKRCKECFWATCGYVILAIDLRALSVPKPLEQAC